jgi:UDP-glucose 4-epimerase
MRTLVTGGAGFIGSHVVDRLISGGHDVAVIDSLVSGQRGNLNNAARFHEVDIRDPRLTDVLRAERPEVVFHLAAQPSVKASTDNPGYDADVNVRGLLNVLEACTEAGVRKIVFASSGAVYGNPRSLPFDEDHPQEPESPYGITKLMGEHYLSYYALDRNLQYTTLRFANVYGPRQDPWGEAGVVAIFIRRLLARETPVIHWDGEQVRDYIYVDDVAQAVVLAADAGDGRRYCVGTGVGTSVNQLYRLLCDVLSIDITPARGPRRAGDLRAAFFNIRRARQELDWMPSVDLRDGLTRTGDWFRRALTNDAIAAGSRG